jgi:hypothetical protein
MNTASGLNDTKQEQKKTPKTPPPWYVQRWPWLLIMGPLLVVIACAYTGWLAFSREDAMVVDDYYTEGQAINQDLRRDRAATALGLTFDMRYDAAAGRLSGALMSFGSPIAGNIRIHLAHPTQPEKDLQFLVRPDAQGRFSIALPMLEMTRWQVQVESEQSDWRLLEVWKWPHMPAIFIKADQAPGK